MRYTVTLAGKTFEVDLSGRHVTVNGKTLPAGLQAVPGTPLRRLVEPGRTTTFAMRRIPGGWQVMSGGETWDASVEDERTRQLREVTGTSQGAGGRQVVRAPMPGLVLRVEVTEGSQVAAGGGLVVLEAMKMENELTSPIAGIVSAVHVAAGQAVDKGTALLEVSGEP